MPQEEFTDAIMLLKHDHREAEDLFKKFRNTGDDDKKWQLAQQVCTELKIHTMIEEEIFYPATRNAVEKDLYKEAFVEHDAAKVLINDIMACGGDTKFFEAKIKVLCEEVEHHIKEEEKPKDGYFAQVRESEIDLTALRDRLTKRKQELKAQATSEGLPPAQTAAVHVEPA